MLMMKQTSLLFSLGLLLRIIFVIYGEWHDRNNLLKFTDIDYDVFHDGSGYVALQGMSPYFRSTYRYTPILAWLLTGNHFLFKSFGKIIFILCDMLVGWLLFRITPANHSTIVYASWLFNPLAMAISARGNAESIIACLVLLSVYLVLTGRIMWGAIMHGIAVHFKIYPVIYSVAFLSYMTSRSRSGLLDLISWSGIKFGIVSALTFQLLTGICYNAYGWEFLENTYLYHVGRKDHRHNFSVYHLFIYLSYNDQSGIIWSLLTFLPQFALVIIIGIVYGKDLPFAIFLQTFAFVTFNKVCTSQYFIWFISLIAPAIGFTSIKLKYKGLCMLILWILGQAVWLSQAYRLEMLGQNTFIQLWFSGVLFFLINSWIIYEFVRNYSGKANDVQKKVK